MNARNGFAALIVTFVVAALALGAGYLFLHRTAVAPQQASTAASTTTQPASTTSPASTTAQVSWNARLHAVVDGLTDWRTERLPDWRLVGTMTAEERAALPRGPVTAMTKTFNPGAFANEDAMNAATQKEDALVSTVKQTLAANGWTLTVSPHEGGFYQDYVYVKDGNALVLEIGTRNAVIGGMYVSMEFAENR